MTAYRMRRQLVMINILSICIIVILGVQIVFTFYQGGWLAKDPSVEIYAENNSLETLRVVGDIDFAPYSSENANGSYTGHDIECINEIANRMGMNVDLRLMTWSRAVQALKDGEADVLLGLESISNRKDGLMITSILAEDHFVVYGKEPILAINDLKSHRIATLRGNTEIDIYGIKKNAIEYDTYSQMLDAVESDAVEYAVMRASVTKMLLAKTGYTDLIQVYDLMDSDLGLGVREDQMELATRLEMVISSMRGDGTLSMLQDKWLTTYVSHRSFRDLLETNITFYLMTLFAVVLSILGILFLFQQEAVLEREELSRHALNLKEIQLAKQEAELADSRARIMLSQIRPHFLYNVLGTIGQLCRKDPAQAADAVDSFARYLRSNLSAVENRELIPFEHELQHVRNYILLEQLRFGEDLQMEYDIQCCDFMLPPLSVQPLVENAVKHGIGQKEDGGKVILKSCETADGWEVRIIDDGVGFEIEQVKEDGRLHIGIDNVRMRVQSMCHGRLLIESEPGVGTCAILFIPKEGEEK